MIHRRLRKHINAFAGGLTLCLIFSCFLLISWTTSAETDKSAHWPVEVTSSWSAVYGTVTGITMSAGDCVGMFDSAGNCYGAGIYDGSYFHISAYRAEEADSKTEGDFSIPGFKDGDVVTFKIYKITTYREYSVVTASGTPFIYQYQGIYPPIRLDLVYERTLYESQAKSESAALPDTSDSWVGESITDEIERLREEKEAGEAPAEASEEPLESIDEDTSKVPPPELPGEEESEAKDHLHPEEMAPPEEMAMPEEAAPPDEIYYRPEEMAPSEGKDTEEITDYAEEDASTFDASKEEKEIQKIKRLTIEAVDLREKPARSKIPLAVKIILLVATPILLTVTVKKLYRRK